MLSSSSNRVAAHPAPPPPTSCWAVAGGRQRWRGRQGASCLGDAAGACTAAAVACRALPLRQTSRESLSCQAALASPPPRLEAVGARLQASQAVPPRHPRGAPPLCPLLYGRVTGALRPATDTDRHRPAPPCGTHLEVAGAQLERPLLAAPRQQLDALHEVACGARREWHGNRVAAEQGQEGWRWQLSRVLFVRSPAEGAGQGREKAAGHQGSAGPPASEPSNLQPPASHSLTHPPLPH